MINLLPPAERQLVHADYRRRWLVISGFLVFGLLVIGIINLASLLNILRVEGRGLTAALTQAQSEAKKTGTTEVAKSVSDLNRKLGQLGFKTNENRLASATLPKIIAHRNPEIKLDSLGYDQTAAGLVTLNLSGLAGTRQALLDFIAALRQDQTFAAVGSPVSNLIKDRDIAFTLQLQIHEP